MQNLEHSLKLNMTVPVYLFWGEEDLLMEEYIRKVSHVVAPDGESWSVETYHGDEASPDEILFALASSGLFAARKLVVVRDAPWFKKKNKTDEDSAKEEKDAVVKQLIQYCADPNPDIVLILTARNIIKTSKLVKAIAAAGRVVEFSCPKGAEREIWLANYFKNCGKMPEKGVCAYVSLMCGEGLGLLKGEADKLLLYAGDHSHITMADAEQVVSTSALAGVFELIARGVASFTLPGVLGFTGICLAGPFAWMAAAIPLGITYFIEIRKMMKDWKQRQIPVAKQ